MANLAALFSLENRVAVVTGGSGVLGGAMARGLADAGARVAVLGRDPMRTHHVADSIIAGGGEALPLLADVTDPAQLTAAREAVLEKWGWLDILVNTAGGNVAAATVAPDASFFDLSPAAFQQALDLNLTGTLVATQVFATVMVANGRGCIVNISSMAAQRALTRVVGYGAAKAAVDNLTRWLAVELAQKYGGGLRVNAIAPGFFVGDQNRSLLLNPDDSLTARGQTIITHTPAGRFGVPDDLISTLVWLCGDGARFVTGVVVPVDGGFSTFSGV